MTRNDVNTRNAVYGAIVRQASSTNSLPDWACSRMDAFLYNKRLNINSHIEGIKKCLKFCPNTRCVGWMTYAIVERYPHIYTSQIRELHLILDDYIEIQIFDMVVFDDSKFNVNECQKYKNIVVVVKRKDILDLKWDIMFEDEVLFSGISADNYEFEDVMKRVKKDIRLRNSSITWKYL